MPTYLVERYWPGVTIEQLLWALQRGRHVMEQMGGEGTQVRDISCTLIPTEEVVFSVYEAPSVAVVRQLNERARIPVSRIVDAIDIGPARPISRSDALGPRLNPRSTQSPDAAHRWLPGNWY